MAGLACSGFGRHAHRKVGPANTLCTDATFNVELPRRMRGSPCKLRWKRTQRYRERVPYVTIAPEAFGQMRMQLSRAASPAVLYPDLSRSIHMTLAYRLLIFTEF